MNPDKNPWLSFGLALGVLLVFSTAARSARLVEGSFLATTDCPAYVSKFRQTNPDDIKLVPGRVYPLFETNYDLEPDYYRIRIEEADPKERWVAAECGEYPPKSSPAEFAKKPKEAKPLQVKRQCPPSEPGTKACRTCGKADSYVLDLYWRPGFCESQRGHLDDQPWCRTFAPGSYAARNFALRSLRPIRRSCGEGYGYCGTVAGKVTPFTDYPPVELDEEAIRETLGQIMPGVTDGSGVERHEWHRNGTCSGFPADAFFQLAGDLARQFNASGMGEFMTAHLGKKVRRTEFFQQIEASLGAGARAHINIECSKDGKGRHTAPRRYRPGCGFEGTDPEGAASRSPWQLRKENPDRRDRV